MELARIKAVYVMRRFEFYVYITLRRYFGPLGKFGGNNAVLRRYFFDSREREEGGERKIKQDRERERKTEN